MNDSLLSTVSLQALLSCDVDQLFEKNSIKELRQLEKNIRCEIEKKKEEVRLMVGERYRDLIEAADTISEMKQSICKVTECISSMENQCEALEDKEFLGNKTKNENTQQFNPYYTLAIEIKFLLDVPGKIWCLMENNQFLQAAELYLLANHVHTKLHLSPPLGFPVSAWFPVTNRQWATTSQFKATLLATCKNNLKNTNASVQVVSQCVCVLLILNQTMIEQTFDELLRARLECVQEFFNSNKKDSSIKEQICQTVGLIMNTLQLIYCLFLDDTDSKNNEMTGLLDKSLKNFLAASKSNSISNLPDSLSEALNELYSTLKIPNSKLSSTEINLQQKCKTWINEVKSQVSVEISRVITYITTVKGLAVIRDAIYEMIREENVKRNWSEICDKLLGVELNLWEDIFQSLFINQTKEIIENRMASVFDALEERLSQLTENELHEKQFYATEQDISLFLWMDSSEDLVTNSANSTRQTDMNLTLKAKGFTPFSRNLCDVLNSDLSKLVKDIQHFHRGDATDNKLEENVAAILRNSVLMQIKRLLFFCEKLVDQRADTFDDLHSGQLMTRILSLTRFLTALTEFCPALQTCITGLKKSEDKVLSKKDLNMSDATIWNSLKTELINQSLTMLRRWKEIVIERARKSLDEISKPVETLDAIKFTPQWETVDIQEENEDGKMVSSQIRIPGQASWTLLKILYSVCLEINRAGGHFLAREILQELQANLLSVILAAYETKLSNSKQISQINSLQLVFDVRFVSSLIMIKDDSTLTQRIERLIDSFETNVDPFDLDVFWPHIQTNLKRCVQRCLILLGALVNATKTSIHLTSATRSNSSQSEQYNILSVTSPPPHFTLLPLANNNLEITPSFQTNESLPHLDKPSKMKGR